MAAPRSPNKPRLAPPPAGTPSARATPAVSPAVSRTRVKDVGASPQVKAALAALRRQRQTTTSTTASSTSSLSASSSAASLDPFSTPAKRSSGGGNLGFGTRAGATTNGNGARKTQDDGLVLEWGGKSTESLLEEAKTTGRLSLASRELKAIPSRAYSTLMPITSPYHPSNKAPPTSRVETFDFTISSGGDSSSWEQQVDLRTLIVASNEIAELEEEIGGFEDLEHFDIHNNYLTSLPLSVGHLNALTILNLSSNKLTTFPLQLLSLNSLITLNLSSNQLTQLWPSSDWSTHLSDLLRPPGASPSATPETPETARKGPLAFWESFPSSPTKSQHGHPSFLEEGEPKNAPFPKLTSLNLSDNPWEQDVFRGDGFALPRRLTKLEIADTGLRDGAFPIEVLGGLKELRELDLSGSAIGDGLFAGVEGGDGRWSPSLRRLDLSRNEIDSLETIEAFLQGGVGRKIEWVGLEKVVMNLIRAKEIKEELEGSGGAVAKDGERTEVIVRDNLMRQEQGRRRKMFPPSTNGSNGTTTPPASATTPSATTPAAATVGDGKEEVVEAAVSLQKQEVESEEVEQARKELAKVVFAAPEPDPAPSSTPTTPTIVESTSASAFQSSSVAADDTRPIASDDDPALLFLTMHLKPPNSLILSLASLSLSSLPILTTGAPPPSLPSLRTLNLSHNLLDSLSSTLEAIVAWSWHSSLVELDLSYNKLIDSSLPSSLPPFPHLTTLTLSNNSLTTLPLLPPSTFPSLTSLLLSYNKLTTLDNISQLQHIPHLALNSNAIEDLSSLCSLAESGLTSEWKVTELDIRNNEIARLPPTLGLLPHSLLLHITGNRFRVPRREVYEHAERRELLPWLKDRL